MPLANTVIDMTSSMFRFSDKRDQSAESHFRCNSIKKFVYLSTSYSTLAFNFDLFSKVSEKVRLIDFIICELIVGMPYMCMDSFIRQYTRRLDTNRNMNPLLRGITYGLFLQTALWTLIVSLMLRVHLKGIAVHDLGIWNHAGYLADSMRYLVSSLREEPSWTECQRADLNITCVPATDVILRCRSHNKTNFNTTSSHFYYLKSFSYIDRSIMTTRFFVTGLVWIFNFFFATVQDDTLLKLFKLTLVCRLGSSIMVIIVIVLSKNVHASTALLQTLDLSAPHSYTTAMSHTAYTYGIGFLSLFDFGSLSPHTMTDNAVVIFCILFTTMAFLRSWIVRILYLVLTDCVEVSISLSQHYLIFAVLPLSTEFFYAHKLFIFYIYFNLMIATMAYVTMLTLTMSKLLQSEFRFVKNIYIIGILCCVGFGLSVPITVSFVARSRVKSLIAGLDVTVLYLGGFKVAIVMWVYGVQRFTTDIHFWLGFKPTKFWTLCWIVLPIILLLFLIKRVYLLTQLTDFKLMLTSVIWILFTLLVVSLFQIKSIAQYLLRNNLAAAFSSSKKYGPPDPEDRKRRRMYNVTMRLRQCKHNCNVIDEGLDCNHLPLINKGKLTPASSNSEPSTTHIYEATTTNVPKTDSTIIDKELHH